MVLKYMQATRHILLKSLLLGFLAWTFILPSELAAITITEIFFHPALDDPDESLEFVEIYNEGSIVEDISGYFFSRGIKFVFPENTFLRSKQTLVICVDEAAVRTRFGIENVIGNFTGRLDNGGETIALVNPNGSPIAEVKYRDRGSWPAAADGTGYTLSILEALGDPGDPQNWIRSSQKGGTPGIENFPPPLDIPHEIFSHGLDWKFRKGFNDTTKEIEEYSEPREAWRQLDFDDSSWIDVLTPVGFGEDVIVTPLDDMRHNYISFALRRKFTITAEQMDTIVSLTLDARLDDGCVAGE